MARRKTHIPLNVFVNNRLVGRLDKETSGAIRFQYHQVWLDWEHRFALSLSLPLRTAAYRGEPVMAVFDNLLPDSEKIRRRVAERTGAQGIDSYSLLAQIGRDCVGAMQFLPDDMALDALAPIEGEPIADDEIEALLANLALAPLGIDEDHDFRLSVAGAQEKTALLFHDGRWKRPHGSTPTTHILKPQIGEIPSASGMIDMSNSVDNEHYCLQLLAAFGLTVATTQVATFGARKVLVVERFDREWRPDGRLLRLPQEDCCQALGVPPGRKYQNQGGPGVVDIAQLLQGSDDPLDDRAAFFKSQILFWLIGATDGHAKNFSVFLRPGGGYSLTPFYDVLSAQPVFDAHQIPRNKYKLAMSVGTNRKYAIDDIAGRHFVETAKQAGLGPTLLTRILEEIIGEAATAPARTLDLMPAGFVDDVHHSIVAALPERLRLLEAAFAAV